MKVEERIEEAIYQLEKIKDEIVDYDSCREEAISATEALEQIYRILQDNREYMYIGQPIVDKIIDQINIVIKAALGQLELEPLLDDETLSSIAKFIQTELKTNIASDKLTASQKQVILDGCIRQKLDSNWHGLLDTAKCYDYSTSIIDNKLFVTLKIKYPDCRVQDIKLSEIPL